MSDNFKVNQKVTVTRGHYKGRPGIIRHVHRDGNYCVVALTDTPMPNAVTINNMTWNDMRKR
ncbi:hypothetical protein SEA_MOAB_155 [Streptomyces phage Moab]|nr:hypothetical protein SEA_MOAB_155 [Streptomyces phage Moab]WMI33769.1 hypothetical protein SEA_PATELGO_157 [Streptomyces phage Patelgo]